MTQFCIGVIIGILITMFVEMVVVIWFADRDRKEVRVDDPGNGAGR